MEPNAVDFDAPLKGRIEKNILDSVRKRSGKWDGSCKEVVALRAAVLKAQGYRCSYCRRNIVVNEVGHREMDHILPKLQSPTDGFDANVACDNTFGVRRHTKGYPAFTFEPENLAVSCKRCNSYKGTFDPLIDRAINPRQYPGKSAEFLWIHPYYDVYGSHIEIQGGGIYVEKSGSDKGRAVIKACGLDKSDELSKMLVETYVLSNMELTKAMFKLVFSVGVFDVVKLAESFAARYGVANAETMEKCLSELLSSEAAGIGVLQRALNSVKHWLGTDAAIYAPISDAVT